MIKWDKRLFDKCFNDKREYRVSNRLNTYIWHRLSKVIANNKQKYSYRKYRISTK